MLLTLGRSIILSLPARILNILLSPGGDGNLLGQVDDILFPSNFHKGFTFSSFALISTHFLLSNLVSFLFLFLVGKVQLTQASEPGPLHPWPFSSNAVNP